MRRTDYIAPRIIDYLLTAIRLLLTVLEIHRNDKQPNVRYTVTCSPLEKGRAKGAGWIRLEEAESAKPLSQACGRFIRVVGRAALRLPDRVVG